MPEQKTEKNTNYDDALEKCVDVKDEIADFVKKNPWAALAVAAGIGFLIARLLSGNKN